MKHLFSYKHVFLSGPLLPTTITTLEKGSQKNYPVTLHFIPTTICSSLGYRNQPRPRTQAQWKDVFSEEGVKRSRTGKKWQKTHVKKCKFTKSETFPKIEIFHQKLVFHEKLVTLIFKYLTMYLSILTKNYTSIINTNT